LAVQWRNVASLTTKDQDEKRSRASSHNTLAMRLRILGLVLGLLGVVSALSAQGQKLLVVNEDEGESSKYSQFWADLQGRPDTSRTTKMS